LTLLRQALELRLEPADLNEVIEAGLAGLQPAAKTRLLKKLEPLPKVSLDAEQMQKVLTNSVLNAWDAVSHKDGDAEVSVNTCRQNGWVVLSVSDNGCGMAAEFVSRSLFRPFQTTKKKGIGIGMFHTKAIVEAHRGKIEVNSQPGKGTTFRVLLPCLEKHS
jgi:signal transduction histidine kinase